MTSCSRRRLGRHGGPAAPILLRDDLDAAKLPTEYVSPDGERSPFTFHAIRHTFASWLGSNGVDGDLVDRLLGQSPHTVRGRHYQAPDLAQLARAVGTLKLALPDARVWHTSRPPQTRNVPRTPGR